MNKRIIWWSGIFGKKIPPIEYFCYPLSSGIISILGQYFKTFKFMKKITKRMKPMRNIRKKHHLTSKHQDLPVSTLYQKIVDDLSNGKKVYLYGHSFGGLIVNRICEVLMKEAKRDGTSINLNNLYVSTFGSIYISELLDGINIKQYMIINDVALKQNQLVEPDYVSTSRSTSRSKTTSKSRSKKTRSKSRSKKTRSKFEMNGGLDKEKLEWTEKTFNSDVIKCLKGQDDLYELKQMGMNLENFNNFKYHQDDNSKIIWLKTKQNEDKQNYEKFLTKKGILIGSSEEWKVHNMYIPIMYLLIIYTTNNIEDIEYLLPKENLNRIKETFKVYNKKFKQELCNFTETDDGERI